jgi:lanthanide-dependent methanol dehydrogenase
MKKPVKSWLIASTVAALLAGPAIANANSEVEKLTKNPANWATWGGNYQGTRYSELKQINTSNVKTLQPAWTFSTGVLRGHEGGPLVVNDTLYITLLFLTRFTRLTKKLNLLSGNIPQLKTLT